MLVRNIDTIRDIIELQKEVAFDKFEPVVQDVELNIVIDLLGQDLYDALDAYIDGGGTGNADYDKLLGKLNGAIVYLTFDNGFDLFNAKNTATGFVRIGGDNVKDMFVGQERRLRKKFRYDGYNRLDNALVFIEANEAAFPEWTGIVDRDVFVFRTSEFNKIYDIRKSRVVFLDTVPVQRTAQEKHLRSVLGSALFDQLLAEVESDTLTPDNATLLIYVQKPAAWWAVVEGGVSFQEKVLEKQYAVSGSAQSYDMRDDFRGYDEKMIDKLLDSATENAKMWTSRLKMFLAENAETYNYTIPTHSSKWDISSDDLDKTVVI